MTERIRLVTEQNGKPHNKTVVLTEEEAYLLLQGEEAIYRRNGWTVTRSEEVLVARKDKTVRVVSLRRLNPMEDM